MEITGSFTMTLSLDEARALFHLLGELTGKELESKISKEELISINVMYDGLDKVINNDL